MRTAHLPDGNPAGLLSAGTCPVFGPDAGIRIVVVLGFLRTEVIQKN